MLSSSLPSLAAGALKNREDPKLLGTAKVCVLSVNRFICLMLCQESSLLQPASSFYKTFAIDCSRAQVSVDMFLFSASYQDVATLGKGYILDSDSDLLTKDAQLAYLTTLLVKPTSTRPLMPLNLRMQSSLRMNSPRSSLCPLWWKQSCVCVQRKVR